MSRQVKIIIKNNKNRYLMLRRSDTENKEHVGNWECPGGKLEEGETFAQAAVREAKEETNITIIIQRIVKEIWSVNELVAVVYLASSLTDEVVISEEHSAFGWYSYEELKLLDPITHKNFFMELIDISRDSNRCKSIGAFGNDVR